MRRARLDRFAILDHRLDAKRLHGAGKALSFGLLATDHGYRQILASKGLVNAEHRHRFLPGLRFRLMRGVAFLPKEFDRAKKHSRPQLPANDVRPLVEQNRQIAPGFYPSRIRRTDDRFGCRANDKWFGKRTGQNEFAVLRFQAVMRHDGAFFGKTFDVRGLFFEKLSGMKRGKYAFPWPVALNIPSSPACMCSHIA